MRKEFKTPAVVPLDRMTSRGARIKTFNKFEETTTSNRYYPTEKRPAQNISPFQPTRRPFIARSQVATRTL